MGIGSITPDSAGSVTAPSRFPLTFSGPSGKSGTRYSPRSWVYVPGLRAVLWADGVAAPHHIVSHVLKTGLLAPSSALAASSGSKATTTLTTTGNFSDGDRIRLGQFYRTSATSSLAWENTIVFKSTLAASGTDSVSGLDWSWISQVKIGASAAATLANLENLIDAGGVEGTDYLTSYAFLGLGVTPSYFMDIDVSASTSSTITFRCLKTGTYGNNYLANEYTDGGGTYSMTGSGNFSGGTAPSAGFPAAGYYRYGYTYTRAEDGAESGLSDTTALDLGAKGQVSLSSIADPDVDDDIDGKRWYRTTTLGVDYYRGYDIAEASTTDTDDISDDTISGDLAVIYDPTIHRSYSAGPIPRVRHVAMYRGRVFGAGAEIEADYTAGTMAYTTGNDYATCTGGYMRSAFEGREVVFGGETYTYRIVRVDESSNIIYLDRATEGPGSGSITYKVTDSRDPFELFFSEPLLPNDWPVTNSIQGVTSPVGEGVTGLVSMWGSLVIFTRTGVWRLSGQDTLSWQVTHEAEGCGCVSGASVVAADGVLYWLGDDGIYQWAGGSDPLRISSPPATDGYVRGVQRTIQRINPAHARDAVGHYDERTRVLRWWLALDSDQHNRHCLVYDLQTGAWGLDTAEDVTCVESVPDQNGKYRTIAGDILGCLWELDVSNSDGAYGFEPVVTISSSTVSTITCSGASFPTSGDGLAGVPVWAIDSSGNFTRHRFVSNTGTVGTLLRYTTAPTGTLVTGGILLDIATGRFHLDMIRLDKTLTDIDVHYEVDTDGQFWVAHAKNQDTAAITSGISGDLTDSKGSGRFTVGKTGRYHVYRLVAIEPGCDPTFLGVDLHMIPRDETDF